MIEKAIKGKHYIIRETGSNYFVPNSEVCVTEERNSFLCECSGISRTHSKEIVQLVLLSELDEMGE